MISELIELTVNHYLNGTKYCTLDSIIKFEQPTKYIVKTTNYNDDYKTPVLTAGQTFILGYTDEIDNIYEASNENPVIIFDDFTGAFKWVDFPFKVKSSAMKILKEIPNSVLLRYVYHQMSNIAFSSSEHKRLWISIYSQFRIPIPPLDVQHEIVRILDSFTELTSMLTTELTVRKQQYEYYKTKLLNFDINIQKCEVGKILKRTKGTDITAQQMTLLNKQNGEVRIFAGGKTIADVDFKDIPKKDIRTKPSIIVKSRGNIGFEYYDKPFSHKNEFWSYYSDDENINIKFVYYIFNHYINHFQNIANNMQMPQISIPVTDKYLIPIPSIENQNYIVDILDKFDKLVNDTREGIPAEITARQKQYEYYRDKLLTFKEVGNESI